LLVTPQGQAVLALRLSFSRQPETLALGTYPEFSLEKAENVTSSRATLLENGIDPSILKRVLARHFIVAAREWQLDSVETRSESA